MGTVRVGTHRVRPFFADCKSCQSKFTANLQKSSTRRCGNLQNCLLYAAEFDDFCLVCAAVW